MFHFEISSRRHSRVNRLSEDSIDPAGLEATDSDASPSEADRAVPRDRDSKARQNIERVTALLQKIQPGLVAGEVAPGAREVEAPSGRRPLLLAFVICALAWLALALILW